MSNFNKISVKKITINPDQEGQRVDNFLRKLLPGVPNSLIYKIIRDGQVRVNSGRIKPLYRLKPKDIVRIPPVSIDCAPEIISSNLIKNIRSNILFENSDFFVINKPPGIAVHSGTKIKHDIISSLKSLNKYKNIALVHRLDKNTSGCLIISKNYHTASTLGKIFKENNVNKQYIALLSGQLKSKNIAINQPLLRERQNYKNSITISKEGKPSSSVLTLKHQFKSSCLVDINIMTGRTHQIRVHSSSIGNPVCGDTKYGDVKINKQLRLFGLKRMFLHAQKISFFYKKNYIFEAKLPEDLSNVVKNLKYDVEEK